MKDYRRYHYDENKLIDYGFKKQGYKYIYIYIRKTYSMVISGLK